MIASDTKVMPGTPSGSNTGLQPSREELLAIIRSQNPELEAEDAFEVPNWFIQQITWLGDSALSDSVAFNYPLLLRIRGPLNESALRLSLQWIVRQHGTLRSVFRGINGRLIQIVAAPHEFSLPIKHLEGSPEARELQMREEARSEAIEPFDLTRGPMLRAKLMRLQANDHVLLLTTHTIVYDDWSTGVLINELSEIYGVFARGTTPADTKTQFQFGDFARWQHERLQGPELESHLAFWKQNLNSSTAFEHLPADYARPSRKAHTGAKQTGIFPANLGDSLKILCRQEKVSLFMVLLAGFKCLLHRYSGDEEIGVASCAANRALMEVEGLIGRFGNTMLLRTSLSDNPTFGELLNRLRVVTLNASSHLEMPFGMLLERIGGWEDPSRNPPCQVVFILQNAPKDHWRLAGLEVDWLPLETGTSKQDLIVFLKSEPSLEITLEYDTEVFEAASMSRLLADYRAILETMAKNPKTRINSVPISPKPGPAGARPSQLTASGIAGAMGEGHEETLIQGNVLAAPEDSVEQALGRIWSELLGVKHVAGDDDYFGLGGDSLVALRLVTRVNAVFGVNMQIRTLLECPTLNSMAEFIKTERKDRRSDQPARGLRGNGSGAPLFYIPGAWGYEFLPRQLAEHLGKTCRYFDGLQYPGLDGRGPVPSRVEDIARYLIPQIRSVWPDGPYFLAGWSFGGTMAFEIARQMLSQGLMVKTVFLLDSAIPRQPRRKRSKMEIINIIRRRWLTLKGRERMVFLRDLAFRAVRLIGTQETRDAKAKPKESSSMKNAVLQAEPKYCPGDYSGKVVLFKGDKSEWFGLLHAPDPSYGWRELVRGGLEIIPVPGDHRTMFDEGGSAIIAEQIRARLAAASEKPLNLCGKVGAIQTTESVAKVLSPC